MQGLKRPVAISNWYGHHLRNVPLDYSKFSLLTPGVVVPMVHLLLTLSASDLGND